MYKYARKRNYESLPLAQSHSVDCAQAFIRPHEISPHLFPLHLLPTRHSALLSFPPSPFTWKHHYLISLLSSRCAQIVRCCLRSNLLTHLFFGCIEYSIFLPPIISCHFHLLSIRYHNCFRQQYKHLLLFSEKVGKRWNVSSSSYRESIEADKYLV